MMTWGEFKKYIEVQGVEDEMVVFYIDVSCPDGINNPPVAKLPPANGSDCIEDQLTIENG